ncbi:MAG TPA: 2-oxoisovalerate dehydrogenase [Mucilaginibacter sp.]|jgi:predicted RNase H-like HicB family nuclease
MKELLFLVNEAEEGGYYAEAVGVGIFAEGETIEELKKSVKSGIACYYENSNDAPSFAHLHFVKDEVIAL